MKIDIACIMELANDLIFNHRKWLNYPVRIKNVKISVISCVLLIMIFYLSTNISGDSIPAEGSIIPEHKAQELRYCYKHGPINMTGKETKVVNLGRLQLAKGMIEFYAQIEWPEPNKNFHCMGTVVAFIWSGNNKQKVKVYMTLSGASYGHSREIGMKIYNVDNNDKHHLAGRLLANCLNWRPGKSHKISLLFNYSEKTESNELFLYFNEQLQDSLKGFKSMKVNKLDSVIFGPVGENVKLIVTDLNVFSGIKYYYGKNTDNLVANYSFEDDVNLDSIPDGWRPFGKKGTGYWGGAPSLQCEERGINIKTDEDSFSGRYSAKMIGLAEGVGGQIITSCHTLKPATSYEFDAAVKSSNKIITFSFKFFDHQNKLLKEKNKTIKLYLPNGSINQWVILSDIAGEQREFTTPENCRKMNVYLRVKGKKTILWDDIYIVRKKIKNNKNNN